MTLITDYFLLCHFRILDSCDWVYSGGYSSGVVSISRLSSSFTNSETSNQGEIFQLKVIRHQLTDTYL